MSIMSPRQFSANLNQSDVSSVQPKIEEPNIAIAVLKKSAKQRKH